LSPKYFVSDFSGSKHRITLHCIVHLFPSLKHFYEKRNVEFETIHLKWVLCYTYWR